MLYQFFQNSWECFIKKGSYLTNLSKTVLHITRLYCFVALFSLQQLSLSNIWNVYVFMSLLKYRRMGTMFVYWCVLGTYKSALHIVGAKNNMVNYWVQKSGIFTLHNLMFYKKNITIQSQTSLWYFLYTSY